MNTVVHDDSRVIDLTGIALLPVEEQKPSSTGKTNIAATGNSTFMLDGMKYRVTVNVYAKPVKKAKKARATTIKTKEEVNTDTELRELLAKLAALVG